MLPFSSYCGCLCFPVFHSNTAAAYCDRSVFPLYNCLCVSSSLGKCSRGRNGVIFDDNELTSSLLLQWSGKCKVGGCFCFALLGFFRCSLMCVRVCVYVVVCVLNYAYQETIQNTEQLLWDFFFCFDPSFPGLHFTPLSFSHSPFSHSDVAYFWALFMCVFFCFVFLYSTV